MKNKIIRLERLEQLEEAALDKAIEIELMRIYGTLDVPIDQLARDLDMPELALGSKSNPTQALPQYEHD